MTTSSTTTAAPRPATPAAARVLRTVPVLCAAVLAGCGATPTPRPTVTVTAATTVTVTAPPDTRLLALDGPPPAGPGGPGGSDAEVTAAGEGPAVPATDDPPTAVPTTAAPARQPATTAGATADPAADPTDGLAAELDAALAGLDPTGRLGIALAPVGGGPVVVAGPEQSNLAWSTVKVPIAIAALAVSDRHSTRALARRAITVSDNAATASLYQRAGYDAVADVVRRLGDDATHLDPVKYGRTSWRLENQARFASDLPCRAVAAPVLDLMGQVAPGQRWGLGRLDGARFKGGWGPQTDGFVARQLGVLDAGERGQVAVAIMSRAGGMTDATAALDRVAELLRDRRDRLPAGRCGSHDDDHDERRAGGRGT